METVLVLIAGLLTVSFGIFYFWSIIWGYKDAASRGKNGFAVATFIALFTWPFGLLFWIIVRPEGLTSTKSSPETIKTLSESNKYVTNFKEMPLPMKILLLVSVYSLFTTILDFVQLKPVIFEYFNSGFPKNYPIIWYVYNLLFNVATVAVYFKRSYSVLKKYIYITLGALGITALNSLYLIISAPLEQRSATTFTILFTFIFAGLIITYLLNQKKYFHIT